VLRSFEGLEGVSTRAGRAVGDESGRAAAAGEGFPEA
jgi:hypothetical protein